MEPGDIYYNDDGGFHIIVTEMEKPGPGWCYVFIFELSDINCYRIDDLSKELWGWRKLT